MALGMEADLDLERVSDEHGHILEARESSKNEEQWEYKGSLVFRQEYFEQVMSYSCGGGERGEAFECEPPQTAADSEGLLCRDTPEWFLRFLLTFQKLPARRSCAVLPGANEVSGSGNFIVRGRWNAPPTAHPQGETQRPSPRPFRPGLAPRSSRSIRPKSSMRMEG